MMADRDVKPAFRLVEEASGRWKIELVNFQKFEEERWTPSFGQMFVTAKVESGFMIQAAFGWP